MKRLPTVLAIAVLVLSSLACQALRGGGSTAPSSDGTSPQSSDNGGSGGGASSSSEFPMTSDAYNVTDVGDGSVLYYSKMSADEVLKFYRDTYTAMGYKERDVTTVISDTTFSIVFDGDPSGKAVVIQSVDLGDGSRTISIRLEDI